MIRPFCSIRRHTGTNSNRHFRKSVHRRRQRRQSGIHYCQCIPDQRNSASIRDCLWRNRPCGTVSLTLAETLQSTQNVTGNAVRSQQITSYGDMLFGIEPNGRLHAFDLNGIPQEIFPGGNSSIISDETIASSMTRSVSPVRPDRCARNRLLDPGRESVARDDRKGH